MIKNTLETKFFLLNSKWQRNFEFYIEISQGLPRTAPGLVGTVEIFENWRKSLESLGSVSYPVKDLESLSYPVKDLESLSYPVKDLESLSCPAKDLESLSYHVKDLESLSYPVKDLESLSCPGKDLSPLECEYGLGGYEFHRIRRQKTCTFGLRLLIFFKTKNFLRKCKKIKEIVYF